MKTTLTFISFILIITNVSYADWKQCTMFQGVVRSFAQNSSYIFAGIENEGVYRSSDNGNSWRPVNKDLANKEVFAVATCGENLLAGTSWGLYRSSNNGNNWIRVAEELHINYVYDFFVKDSTVIMTSFGHVYKSSDNGRSWKDVVFETPEEFYAAITYGDSSYYVGYKKGILKSTDGGETWLHLGKDLTSPIATSLIVVDSTLFVGTNGGGMYSISTSGGEWSIIKEFTDKNIRSFTKYDSILFAGTYGEDGIYKSVNKGKTWLKTNAGLSNKTIWSVMTNGETLFAGSGHGIFRSTDIGENWIATNNGLGNITTFSLAQSGNLFVAGTENGVYYSTDKGDVWALAYPLWRNAYSVLIHDKLIFATVYGLGVLRTENADKLWQSLDVDGHNSIINAQSIVVCSSYIFTGSMDRGGVYYSTNDGVNWYSAGLSGIAVYNLVANNTTIFANTSRGLYFSTNFGKSWIQFGKEISSKKVSCLLLNGSVLYVGTSYDGIYATNDTKKWIQVDTGLPTKNISSLALYNSVMYAGCVGNGIFRRSNTAETWTRISTGALSTMDPLSFMSTGSELYVGMDGNGLWKNETSLDVSEKVIENKPDNVYLYCYPNPATNSLTIDRTSLQFPENAPVHYTFSTLIGGKVMEFDNSDAKFTVSLDGMASGVYSLTAEAGGKRAAVMVTVVE